RSRPSAGSPARRGDRARWVTRPSRVRVLAPIAGSGPRAARRATRRAPRRAGRRRGATKARPPDAACAPRTMPRHHLWRLDGWTRLPAADRADPVAGHVRSRRLLALVRSPPGRLGHLALPRVVDAVEVELVPVALLAQELTLAIDRGLRAGALALSHRIDEP